MKKKIAIVLSFLLTVSVAFTGVKSYAAIPTLNESYPVSQGVNYSNYTYTKSNINLLEVNLANPFTKLELSIPSPITSLSTVTNRANSDTKEGHRVVGAINSNFFNMSDGYPLYLIAQYNKILSPEVISADDSYYVSKPIAFGVTADGKAEIDYYDTEFVVNYKGEEIEFDGLNVQRGADEGIIYTPQHHSSKTPTNKYGMEFVVETSETITSTQFGQTLSGKVTKIRKYEDDNRSTIPRNGFVISVNGDALQKFKNVQIGEQMSVTIDVNPIWKDAKFMATSGPLLVYNGKVNLTIDPNSSRARQVTARTAIAIDKDKQKVFLVTVDSGNGSNGMTMTQFANYLVTLGVDRAINLDGGGSTTMGIRKYGSNTVVLANNPSGGAQRRVSAVLEAISTGATGSPKTLKVTRDKVGTMLIGSTVNLTPEYVLDEHYNPVAYKTADFNITTTNNLVEVNGLSYKAVSPGSETIVVANGNASQTIKFDVLDAPSTLAISATSTTIDPNSNMQFTATAKDANGNNLIYSPSQLTWTVEGDIGSVSSSGLFTSNGTIGKGAIVATLGTKSVKKEIEVKESYTKDTFAISNFEDTSKWEVKTTLSKGNHELISSSKFGKEGKYSLKLNYDMTGNQSGTAAAYLESKSPIVLPGNPSKLGVWMFGDGNETWVRGYVKDAKGTKHTVDFTAENGQTWTGWKYVEAELPIDAPRPLTFDTIYIAQPTVSKQKAGAVYFDKLQAVYKETYEEPIFKDVANDYVYKKQIDYLVDNGFISGYTDGTFKPDLNLTRAHAAILLSNVLDLDTSKVTNPDFTDVPKDHPYYKQIAAIENAGVMNGKGDGNFDPNGQLTRAQMAVILVNAFKYTGTPETTFTDVSADYWAGNAIYALAANGITSGYPDQTFKPSDSVSRKHFSLFLYSALTK
nr:S-layer homology domain-containing protein [Lysinibacillus timonensis]